MAKPKPSAQRRIRISVSLPVTVDCYVVDESGDGDWTLQSVHALHCEASARGVMEAMGSAELDEMAKLAEKAKDEA
jgi:hypothetical protein